MWRRRARSRAHRDLNTCWPRGTPSAWLHTSRLPDCPPPKLQYILIFISVFFFVYWSIIASMCCVSFCCIMKWINYKYTYIPSLLRLPHTPPLDHHWALSWAACAIQQLPTSYLFYTWYCIFLLLFGHSVMSDSLWPYELQHAKLPCPSVSPRVSSNSCPLNQWCHPTISSSVVPISSCLHSFPASSSFPMSWLFTSGSQSIGASASHQSFQWIFCI